MSARKRFYSDFHKRGYTFLNDAWHNIKFGRRHARFAERSFNRKMRKLGGWHGKGSFDF